MLKVLINWWIGCFPNIQKPEMACAHLIPNHMINIIYKTKTMHIDICLDLINKNNTILLKLFFGEGISDRAHSANLFDTTMDCLCHVSINKATKDYSSCHSSQNEKYIDIF